ncbi:shikimate kinase [Lacinutrix sp. Bg11-31]|uniref:shikimate kinase n=1 Tax=Lacinutrix sp. Bg11-31 TaxID=2057808 RepID=UPI000C3153A6|nr:shikimate kinase [Lacinutrix sp. Bg11-31]AUC81995.1 shikimate kinase [Lacinutrix sp. Bg11-31]
MNIVLIGYMASGKSKIGVELAKKLNYTFKDLDNVIEKGENKSIKEIFVDSGELYFRKKEKEYLDSLIKESNSTIISLGGGTPCYYDTMESMLTNSSLKTVYLNVSTPVLVSRLNNEKSKRPLIAHIKTDELLTEFIGKHLFERAFYYNKSEVKINANGKVEDIIEDIILQLF